MAIVNSVYISAYVGEAHWLLPAALLIILVPAYLISWKIEYWIVKGIAITDDPLLPIAQLPLPSIAREGQAS